jgi:hypothetical protein
MELELPTPIPTLLPNEPTRAAMLHTPTPKNVFNYSAMDIAKYCMSNHNPTILK